MCRLKILVSVTTNVAEVSSKTPSFVATLKMSGGFTLEMLKPQLCSLFSCFVLSP